MSKKIALGVAGALGVVFKFAADGDHHASRVAERPAAHRRDIAAEFRSARFSAAAANRTNSGNLRIRLVERCWIELRFIQNSVYRQSARNIVHLAVRSHHFPDRDYSDGD